MPLIDETNQAEKLSAKHQTNSFPMNQNSFNTKNTNDFNQSNQSQGLFHIPEKYLQLIPWIPVGLEMLTGQKIPATGVLADILQGIQQLQFNLQQVANQQQLIYAKLESLETNASSQLTNLSQQVANTNSNFKLLATEKRSFVVDQTKRSLEFSQPKIEAEYSQ